MSEFTGERLIPELAEPDLRNEHEARYLWAKRSIAGMRVLDAGCGVGYGSAELAGAGARVTGLDISAEAVAEARSRYPELHFLEGSCEALPFPDAAFDRIVAFEVIEHLEDWRVFLKECRRVLQPAGELLVSTPNARYYAQARAEAGPNPFHRHEFEAQEFRAELLAFFPNVALLTQNQSAAVVLASQAGEARAQVQNAGDLESANFLVAVCSAGPVSLEAFVYVPSAANLLEERERHIQTLNGEIERRAGEHAALVERFRALTQELERSNEWAQARHCEAEERAIRVTALQKELSAEQSRGKANTERLEGELHEVHQVYTKQIEALTQEHGEELGRAVQLLDRAEQTVVERTEWAHRAEAKLNMAAASRWVRLGRKLGVGPKL